MINLDDLSSKTKWEHFKNSVSHTEHWPAGNYVDWTKMLLHVKLQLTQKTIVFTDQSGNEES